MSKITDIEEQTVSISSDDSDDDMHTKGLQRADTARTGDSRTQRMFVVWTVINTLATIGIVFTNKAIFSDPAFKHTQTAFAAFHFVCTSLTLYVLSRPRGGAFFTPARCSVREILPLALAMCLNVVLPNLSLAYSSVTFYQVARILLTPVVAAINFGVYGMALPRWAVAALVPVCVGVGVVSYYDSRPGDEDTVAAVTTVPGVVFAFTGVLASSVYTVWIGSFHKKLAMSSMQLLFNQAPLSAALLLLCVPWADTVPDVAAVPLHRWMLIALSGVFASLINLSQFFIIAGAGAVTSTVVGHAKTCSIVMLGWMMSGRTVADRSLLGIFLAIGGIIFYSMVMLKERAKA